MKKEDELLQELSEKVSKEYDSFLRVIEKLSPKEIIEKSGEIYIRKEYSDMFEGNYYTRSQIKVLLDQENTLDFLYESWMNSDGCIFPVLEESVYNDILDLEEKLKNKMLKDNSNSTLISQILETLESLNFYKFCTHLRERYGVKFFDEILIAEILDNNNTTKELLHYFQNIRNDKHLKYLVEVLTFNPKHYNNISEHIIPELKKIIKNREKTGGKSYSKFDVDRE